MLAFFPPSSSVSGFTWSAHSRMIRFPTSVEPVKTILRTSGCPMRRSPASAPVPGTTWKTSSGMPASRREPLEPQRTQRGVLGRLDDHRVAGSQGRREPPRGDRHREVPRHDHADDPERFMEGDVDPPSHRDLPSGQALRCRGVVVKHVAHVARLPAGVADGVAGVAHLEGGKRLDVRVHRLREAPQQPGPVPWCHRAATSRKRGARGRPARQPLRGRPVAPFPRSSRRPG